MCLVLIESVPENFPTFSHNYTSTLFLKFKGSHLLQNFGKIPFEMCFSFVRLMDYDPSEAVLSGYSLVAMHFCQQHGGEIL